MALCFCTGACQHGSCPAGIGERQTSPLGDPPRVGKINPPAPLTEPDVRRIVREEIKRKGLG